MATVVRPEVPNVDGFEIVTPSGLAGWVEEMWLDSADAPIALALRLLDGRRGLLFTSDVDEVVRERCSIRISDGVRILELEPPHLEARDGVPVASWRATGVELSLPEPPGQLHQAILARHRPIVPAQAPKPERPIWRLMLGVYLALAVIALTVIGLDFLVAYLVTGSAI